MAQVADLRRSDTQGGSVVDPLLPRLIDITEHSRSATSLTASLRYQHHSLHVLGAEVIRPRQIESLPTLAAFHGAKDSVIVCGVKDTRLCFMSGEHRN